MHKEQSLNRKLQNGNLIKEKNETMNTLEIFRRTKRGKKKLIARNQLN